MKQIWKGCFYCRLFLVSRSLGYIESKYGWKWILLIGKNAVDVFKCRAGGHSRRYFLMYTFWIKKKQKTDRLIRKHNSCPWKFNRFLKTWSPKTYLWWNVSIKINLPAIYRNPNKRAALSTAPLPEYRDFLYNEIHSPIQGRKSRTVYIVNC